MVNDKGHVFQVSNLNSSPMDVHRIASSKELTAKSESFTMSFMNLSEEEHVVVAWADSSRAAGWIKKIPVMSKVRLRGGGGAPPPPPRPKKKKKKKKKKKIKKKIIKKKKKKKKKK
jgi:hypothetical protein